MAVMKPTSVKLDAENVATLDVLRKGMRVESRGDVIRALILKANEELGIAKQVQETELRKDTARSIADLLRERGRVVLR